MQNYLHIGFLFYSLKAKEKLYNHAPSKNKTYAAKHD